MMRKQADSLVLGDVVRWAGDMSHWKIVDINNRVYDLVSCSESGKLTGDIGYSSRSNMIFSYSLVLKKSQKKLGKLTIKDLLGETNG